MDLFKLIIQLLILYFIFLNSLKMDVKAALPLPSKHVNIFKGCCRTLNRFEASYPPGLIPSSHVLFMMDIFKVFGRSVNRFEACYPPGWIPLVFYFGPSKIIR